MHRAVREALVIACLLGAGCAAAERGFYAPVGAPAGRSLVRAEWGQAGRLIFDVACQGSYLNEVDGRRTRSVHVQLDVLRPQEGAVTLPLSDFAVTLDFADGSPAVTLSLAEAWWEGESLQRALRVPGWSRRAFDLFFDDAEADRPLADLLRLRWSYALDGESEWGDLLFRRIASGGEQGPSVEPLGDPAFGYRDGFYLPIEGSLGPRAPRRPDEAREHHVFHEPRRWFFGWL